MSQKLKTIALVFFLFMYMTACSDADDKASLKTGSMKGQLAPDFVLKDLDGKQVTLSSFKNKSPVCIIFWATWCPYCVVEIPKVKQMHAKYGSKGLKIIAIDIAANDPMPRVVAFQKKHELPYTVLYDGENTVSRLYGVQGIPVSIIIDKQGIIQYRGYQLPENAEQLFPQLL